MSARGLWVSPTEFIRFGEPTRPLSTQIATRERSAAFFASGMFLYLPNPDPILKSQGKDIRVYRDLRADAHVGGCVRRRKAAVKALEFGIDRGQAKSRVARAVESMLADLDMSRIITEMLDAVLYGYQPMEILWKPLGGLWVPTDVLAKPADWFVYDIDNQLRFRSKENRIQGDPVPPYQFLVPRQDATYENPYGFADLSMCFWPTVFKKGGLKFWVQFTEKYGAPWVIGKHPRGASQAERDSLLDSLEQMVQDAVAVVPNDSSVSIEEASGKAASADVYEKLMHFCRSEVSIALLGQNQTTESDSNRASAQAGLEVTSDIRDSDKTVVEEAVNMLIRWICEVNFDGPRPTFSMWEQETVDKVQAERDEKLQRAGARLTAQYFKRAYKLQDGDIDERPLPMAAPVATPLIASDVAFAEHEAPDQDVLDAALDALSADALNADARAMLAPLLRQVASGAAPDTLLGVLAELYPHMDTDGLQERLARALFTANLWGRLNA